MLQSKFSCRYSHGACGKHLTGTHKQSVQGFQFLLLFPLLCHGCSFCPHFWPYAPCDLSLSAAYANWQRIAAPKGWPSLPGEIQGQAPKQQPGEDPSQQEHATTQLLARNLRLKTYRMQCSCHVLYLICLIYLDQH